MIVKVKLFASLRNQIGEKELEMNVSPKDKVRDIIKTLKLSEKENFITMVNGVHCKLDHGLSDGDVLSVFPMIGGG